jgi:hypothetical protein
MKGIQTVIGLVMTGALSVLLILSLSVAMHLLGRRRLNIMMIGVALAASAAFGWLAYQALADLPVFDWIERCRPDGSGECAAGGRPVDDVRLETWFLLHKVFLIYIVAVLSAALSGVWLLRRRSVS